MSPVPIYIADELRFRLVVRGRIGRARLRLLR